MFKQGGITGAKQLKSMFALWKYKLKIKQLYDALAMKEMKEEYWIANRLLHFHPHSQIFLSPYP